MADKPVLSRSAVTECEGVTGPEGNADHKPSNGKARWYKQTFDPVIAKHPERDAAFITASSTPVEALYTREDLADRNLSFDRDIGYPGEFPYTRGIHPTGYRGKLWTMRQFAGFGTAEDSNERYLRLLELGQTGLSVAFPMGIGTALVLGTTENLGYMSGALKDFFDRVYYPCLDDTRGLPYALYIRAKLDGTGTRRAVESIASGLGWRAVQEPMICHGEWREDFVDECHELGMAMAAGLDGGIF